MIVSRLVPLVKQIYRCSGKSYGKTVRRNQLSENLSRMRKELETWQTTLESSSFEIAHSAGRVEKTCTFWNIMTECEFVL